jgi:hypothetical protein
MRIDEKKWFKVHSSRFTVKRFTIQETPASWFHSAAIELFQSKKLALFEYWISRQEPGNQKNLPKSHVDVSANRRA